VLINFIVPVGFVGPLSALNPPPFLIGGNPGFVWSRFSITEVPVPQNWDGSGMFEDGESGTQGGLLLDKFLQSGAGLFEPVLKIPQLLLLFFN